MTIVARVYVSNIEDNLPGKVEAAFQWINWKSIVKPSARVFIKPNFTFPFYKPGVTTSPEVLEAIVAFLKTRTDHVMIGETDGGANSWKVETAFENHDLPRICAKYDVQMVNLCKTPREMVELPLQRGKVRLELPRVLLKETDVFITVPVPKIHCMTKVSLALKNQWGCIPAAEKRFRYHSHFDEMICHLNLAFETRIVVGDCTYMLTGNGPMFGEQVKADMLVVSDNLGAFELSMLHLMGLETWNIGHIEMAQRMGIIPASLDGTEFNNDWRALRSDKFFLKRTIQNYIALAGFKSRLITWLGYESACAIPLHKLLYAIKENPLKKAIQARAKPD